MQDCSQGFEQEWRFESRCRPAMATTKATQKALRRLPDFVGHPQIEAEPLQNQSGSLRNAFCVAFVVAIALSLIHI